MSGRVITLLTDFGMKDPYVAEMKGVILNIYPQANIIDITHQVEKYNVIQGAFILASAAKYFPKGTIHVVVIDPGVGTKRKAIIIESKRYFFVGPDNGVLTMAAKMDGIRRIIEISAENYLGDRFSLTFHGRDIFAPVAAYLAKGVKIEELGEEIDRIVEVKLPEPQIKGERIFGIIIYVDSFGNIITNISKEHLQKIGVERRLKATMRGEKSLELKICRAYGEVEKGEFLAIIDSFNLLEISMNQGNAAEKLKVKSGEKIEITI
ncbi:MAG: hypothetical protein DRJ30_05200 [Candidatus Methanomethylicota archaeon]|nr:MAG: hypothetical protein DRJ30_05200 [Candidatus Verstraetearchaeota archaeon]